MTHSHDLNIHSLNNRITLKSTKITQHRNVVDQWFSTLSSSKSANYHSAMSLRLMLPSIWIDTSTEVKQESQHKLLQRFQDQIVCEEEEYRETVSDLVQSLDDVEWDSLSMSDDEVDDNEEDTKTVRFAEDLISDTSLNTTFDSLEDDENDEIAIMREMNALQSSKTALRSTKPHRYQRDTRMKQRDTRMKQRDTRMKPRRTNVNSQSLSPSPPRNSVDDCRQRIEDRSRAMIKSLQRNDLFPFERQRNFFLNKKGPMYIQRELQRRQRTNKSPTKRLQCVAADLGILHVLWTQARNPPDLVRMVNDLLQNRRQMFSPGTFLWLTDFYNRFNTSDVLDRQQDQYAQKQQDQYTQKKHQHYLYRQQYQVIVSETFSRDNFRE